MNRNLPQIVADLFATAKTGEDLSPRIQGLRAEIQKAIESEDSIYGKFRGLLESFREIIPDENQRYQAALKALSTTSKLSRQEIVKAVSEQFEELKIIDKGLTPAVPGWRDEFKAMEARAKGTKDEIAKLREIIARLESEEKTVLAGMAAREKEMELVEKTMRELFAAAGAEMTAIIKKMEGQPADGPSVQPSPGNEPGKAAPAAQPVPQSVPAKSDASVEKKENVGQGSEVPAPPAPMDPKFQRKCPNCGGALNLHELDKLWICYNCAYEEPIQGEVRGRDAAPRAVGFEGDLTEEPAPSPSQAPGPDPSPSIAVPLGAMTFDDYKQQKKKSTPPAGGSRSPIKKKTCPVCTKKMFWYPDENMWRCPNCDYERRI